MSNQNGENNLQGRQGKAFNPNIHLVQLKSKDGLKDYLPVQWRLVWFRERCPGGTIETELVHLDLDRETEEEIEVWNEEMNQSEIVVKRAKGLAIFRATVKDGKGGVAMGTKSEKAASFPDFIEKAETGSIGRALAALGYGTQFTGDELNESHRIVDSPVGKNGSGIKDRIQRPANSRMAEKNGSVYKMASVQDDPQAPITEQQLVSIHKLCERLGKAEPENIASLTYQGAKELIMQLSHEYNEQRQSRSKAS